MPHPTHLVPLPDGRVLACDDVGDPDGQPVLYVHGSPDTRLARHPDDGVAARAGVRLVAVDRPGFGHSSPHPRGTLGSFGTDVAVLADALGVDRFAVLGWSAGTLGALGVAARLGPRITRLGIVAGLPPGPAYAEAGVLAGATEGRVLIAELGAELGPEAMADELVPYLVPDPPTVAAAREQIEAGADAVRRAELAAVPGALDRMAEAMVDSVRQGLDGLRLDLVLQVRAPDVDLATITAPAHLWYGELDPLAPPSFGHWLAAALPRATLTVVAGASHSFALAAWGDLLAELADD